MKNIAMVGGMGSGKTTLADAILKEDPTIHTLSMSMYGARIPMTLVATTHPNLLSLSKSEYIQTILENQHIELLDLSGQRQKMDDFEKIILGTYGKDIFGSIAFEALVPGVQNLADNLIIVENVKYLKDKGFYIIGCSCDLATRVNRCLKRGKDIDPKDRSELVVQIHKTDDYFESDRTIKLAEVVYDTTEISPENYQQIAREVLSRTR
jgi:dephospho-CoA kinase